MQMNMDIKELLNSKLLHSDFVNGISKHLSDYEKRVKSVAHELDLRTRDARTKGRKQIDQFASQVKRTRVDLEKRVVSLVNEEAGKLNQRLTDLVSYLKALSAKEIKASSRSGAKKKSSGGKKAKSATSAKARAKKVLSQKKSGNDASASGSSGLPN